MERRQFVSRLAATGGAAAVAASPFGSAFAQDKFPSRNIKVIIPYPAGGIVDITIRAVTDRMVLGDHRLIIENRPGADGRIGVEAAARSAPDGYTLVSATPILVLNELLQPEPTFRARDFVGIGAFAAPSSVFVVPNDSPFQSLPQFIEQARARPGHFNVPNPGIGSSLHLAQELLFATTGVQVQNVGYKGQPPSITDLVQGQMHFGLISQSLVMPHIKAGRLRALAINAMSRSPNLPDVPTLGEAGYPQAVVLSWHGLAAPAQTPRPIVDLLSAAVQKAVALPEARTSLQSMDAQVMTLDGPAFDKLMREELTRWEKLIRERNIKI